MQALLKVAIAIELALFSVNSFATTQQAEELKKFVNWEQQNKKSLAIAFDNVINQITGFQDNTKLDASVAVYHSKLNEHLKALEALNFSTEEIKPLVVKYKDKLNADYEIIKVAVELGKHPSVEAQNKLNDANFKLQRVEEECSILQNELVDKFPIEE